MRKIHEKIFLWGCLAWLVLVQMGCSDRHEDITFPDDGVIRFLTLDATVAVKNGWLIYTYGIDWSNESALYTIIPLAKYLFTVVRKDPYGYLEPGKELTYTFVSSVEGLACPMYCEEDNFPEMWSSILEEKNYVIRLYLDEDRLPVVSRITIANDKKYPQVRTTVKDRKWIDDVEKSQPRTLTFQKIEASTWKDVRAASRAAWEAYEQKMITN